MKLVPCVTAVLAGLAATTEAQVGRSLSNPYVESSAGRAWQRITFGAIDCAGAEPACPADAFTTTGIFGNGTYRNIRANFGGDPAVPNVAESLSNRVFTQSQTFPTASSASGFTFTWRGPTPVRDSDLFGPLFGNRGRTNGRRQLSFTLSVQRLKWETLDGSKIRNGEAGLLWGDPDYTSAADGTQFGYVGRCLMSIDSTVASAALNVGLTDRWDVSVAVPLIHTELTGSNEFLDFARFPDGTLSVDPADTGFAPQGRFFVSGDSTGIGDVAVTTTVALVKSQRAALALSARADLGTGDLEKMTGTGETQIRGGLAGSYELGRVAPHASVWYSRGTDVLFDEVVFIAGVDVNAVRDRVTLNGEVVARRLFDVRGFTADTTLGTVRSPLTGDVFPVQTFRAVRDDFNLFFVNLGGKVRLAGQLLGSAYVLIPTGDDGMQAQKPTFNFGFNYAF